MAFALNIPSHTYFAFRFVALSTTIDDSRSIFNKQPFGGITPFKVKFNFDIPLFEGEIVEMPQRNG